jgi:hypothetical protein
MAFIYSVSHIDFLCGGKQKQVVGTPPKTETTADLVRKSTPGNNEKTG